MDRYGEAAINRPKDRRSANRHQKIGGNYPAKSWKHEITSQPFIRYVRVMLDTRLNFKQQIEHIGPKASVVKATLSQLTPNVEAQNIA